MNSLCAEIHSNHFAVLMQWLQQPAPRQPSAAFLYGPPGVGKTTLAHRVFQAAGFKTIEYNASQFRHKGAMIEHIEPLTQSANVGDYFRSEGRRPIGIILDEIDGMSTGDKGGMTELIRIIGNHDNENAIICISNEWLEKKYQPLLRQCLCVSVDKASLESCATWIGRPICEMQDIWLRHRGDLRKIAQSTDILDSNNDVEYSESVRDLVIRFFAGEFDLDEKLNLENNDLNLAGLHLHETLPSWLTAHYGDNTWDLYLACLRETATSDRQDYYTFFHQHWSLFPLSFQSKLQAINWLLFHRQKPAKILPEGKIWKYKYTAVLARQSWLFNQFKYLCEVRDCIQDSSLRDGGLETALWLTATGYSGSLFADGTKERTERWVKTLTIPPIPPIPQ